MKQYRPHVFVLCVLAVVLTTGIDKPLQNALTAMRFEAMPRPASGDIVLVAIDPLSIETFGVWPWPRSIHADLIKRLDSAGATDIVFDVDFSSASTPGADKIFEDALQSAGGSVVLPTFKQVVGGRGREATVHVTRPLAQFARYSWPAVVNVDLDPDGLVRRYRFGEAMNGTFVPSVGALLSGRHDKNARSLLIDFSIRAASIPTVSFVDVAHGDPAAIRTLKGKKVIIGATALELGDRVNVPNGRVMPGALLQTLAAETILQNRVLRPSSVFVMLGGLAVIILMMLALWRRYTAGIRIAIMAGAAVLLEVGATLLQSSMPIVVETIFFHAAILAYFVAIALDEIDVRDLLGMIAEKRFQRITMSLGDGLICVDRNGIITLWNPGAEALFGHPHADMIGQPFDHVFGPTDARTRSSCVITELSYEALQAPGGKVMELEGRRKNGETFPFEACFSAWQGADGIQYGVVVRDISVRKREAERIEYLAKYDTLTGLPNRNSLYEHLDTKIGANASRDEVAVLLLDIDRFKEINDTLGHVHGDQVLCVVARRLESLIGRDGLVARSSGDEFAVVISGAEIADKAESLARRISECFDSHALWVSGHQHRIQCSIGVSLFPQDCGQVHDLLANADLAMFRAKAAGRGRHVFFSHTIRGDLESRMALTAELERAAVNEEFELFFQPQVRLGDGRIVGAEALIRWRHPQRGLVTPGEFMPVLNTISISGQIAHWVMDTACRQGREWQHKGYDLRLGVNLSPSQFKTGDLAASVADILAETGFSPSLLELEVTENILLADDERAREIFQRIRELGVHIALDDFGTGYASLNYLKKFPITRLKIDQFFVRELKADSNDAAIVEYTINLSRLLDLSVIAEGIEDRSTADLLIKMGCELGQGYYFGRPMPAAQFEEFLLAKTGSPAVSINSAEPTATAA